MALLAIASMYAEEAEKAKKQQPRNSSLQAALGVFFGFVFSKLWLFLNSSAVVAYIHFEIVLYVFHYLLGIIYLMAVTRCVQWF